MIIMSKYFAGIEPLKAGYDRILIRPNFGNLTKISAKVTTLKGDVSIEAKKTNTELSMQIDTPAKTLVGVPKVFQNFIISSNGQKIYENGDVHDIQGINYKNEDENFIYYYIESGQYQITSTSN